MINLELFSLKGGGGFLDAYFNQWVTRTLKIFEVFTHRFKYKERIRLCSK